MKLSKRTTEQRTRDARRVALLAGATPTQRERRSFKFVEVNRGPLITWGWAPKTAEERAYGRARRARRKISRESRRKNRRQR